MGKNEKNEVQKLISLRAPHRATAKVVDIAGHPMARLLYAAAADFNARHFGGMLGQPLVLITPAMSARTLGDYVPRDLHGIESRIRIAPKAAERGERFMLDVLLHELVHAWQHEIGGDLEDSYRGHGPKFAERCNLIGAELGLPKVGVKGRDGKPDCKSWPMCVRPAGYYPEEYVAPKRQKKSKGEQGEAQPESDPAPESSAAKLGRIRKLLRQLTNDECAQVCDLLNEELAFRTGKKGAAA